MSAAAILFTLFMTALLFALPRRYAALPLLLSGCYMTLGPRLVLLGLDFTVFRILVLAGWLRVLGRHEIAGLKPHPMDRVVLTWVAVCIVLNTCLAQSFRAFTYQLGQGYNALGLYFLFRAWIRDAEELRDTVKALALMIVPLAATMLIEMVTGRNLFVVFGGVPDITMMREGRMRCQGPFAHPILAGTFGATVMPLVLSLFWQPRSFRRAAVIGAASATLIMVASSSSGPLLTYIAALVGLAFWRIRHRMQAIRWTLLLMLIGLELVMKSHVWFLIGRLSNVIGGDGWHRSELIDMAIRNFSEWWVCGSVHTADWIRYSTSNVENSADITNQFIFEGVSGGILRLAIFVMLIAFGFQVAGRARVHTETTQKETSMFAWCLGVALLAHTVSFLSVCYFDQMVIYWQFLLAAIATLHTVTQPQPVVTDVLASPSRNHTYSSTLPPLSVPRKNWH
jgi:hypothetical protein